jgi:phosphomannomutase
VPVTLVIDKKGVGMSKKLVAFDLDNTLAESKTALTDEMVARLSELLEKYEVCVISGGNYSQFKIQLTDRIEVGPDLLKKLHLMPTCGTRYYRYNLSSKEWNKVYAEDLSDDQKKRIIEVLEEAAKVLGYWEQSPAGEIIEDRESQITYSALGQKALPEDKYAWDADGAKKKAIRDYAADRLPDLEVRVGGTTSVDVTRVGIDKAYGMRKLMAELKITEDEILFIGDMLQEGGNDYPVKAMGIDSVAVENYRSTPAVVDAIIKVS